MHSEIIRPPRALWVPFILGRPLGQPGDEAFQLRVLRRVLGLLERPLDKVPILEDHDEEADDEVALDGLACPISYAPIEGDGSLQSRLADEIASLRTWYDLGVEQTGRTAFGVSGLSIDDVAAALIGAVDAEPATPPDGRSVADHLRFAAEDLKAFVTEAGDAQPGTMSAYALKAWFWEQTVAGQTLLAAHRAGPDHPDEGWRADAPLMIPMELR